MAQAAVMIGALPIGPTCARKAGLLELARKKSGVLRLAKPSAGPRRPDPQTLDLFAEVEHA
ncbi:hypothetical protein DBR23_10035 [Acidovorax sp. HMWF018]|uniref:hypothetical protein n=1 Tax=Acidovorax sp. HMWF018 TaxID=2056855 RepID=UPI000D384B10|nr:hypothetical protein [Acidovorax sp. HMWF018]PTT39838.1 hypothetical protein DBR23_10035 [Acidovorax sp. HMWF018]